MFTFFIDSDNITMSGFDHRKSDEGYACLLGCDTEKLASQHQMKRFLVNYLSSPTPSLIVFYMSPLSGDSILASPVSSYLVQTPW